MSKKTKYMDALAELSDDDSEDEEGGSEEEEEDPGLKKQKSNKIDLEALQRCGYKSGPSVLLMPTPKESTENWGWGSGQEQKEEERDTESLADREANRAAVNAGLSASVAQAKKAAEAKELQALQRRQEAAEARARAFGAPNKSKGSKDQKDSWNQKEKRKRDAGQATRGKNFVEEEKRLGRSLGMYSGFD